ncbi:hypothetical protein FB451DRAFT_1390530 [Mycena latifolia]|nr:hypothetical protein FB451DRAFT_1390530 [Mycena latifolia]
MRLPQELVEEIIDHLSDDFATLKVFSLVSSQFVARCRSHLFETCTLGPKNILAFHELLRAPRGCTFANQVRAITAFRYSWSDNDSAFSAIAADLRGLRNIRTLALKLTIVADDAAARGDAFFRTGFVTGFPHATELLLSCNFDGDAAAAQPAPLVDMICMLPALQSLVVREMSDSAPGVPAVPALPPSGLRSLKLSAYSVGPILAWLHKCAHLPRVQSLSLPLLLRRDAPVVRAALQQLGGALRHFDFILTWVLDYSDVDPTTVFDLALHPSLTTLSITDRSWADPDEFDDAHLIPFITRLSARALESISFALDLALYRALDWAPLDSFFADAERFPALRRVAFVRTGSGSTPAAQDADVVWLRGKLPRLSAAGEGLGISWPSRTVSVVHLKTLVLRCDHHRLEHLCFSAILLTIHGMIPPLSLLATLPLHRPHNSLGHRQRAPASHVFAPIGNAAYSRRPGVPASSFDVTLMPGEHFTAIRDPPPPTVYFTGDTSYRPMPFSTDDGPEILPVCPAFKDFALHVADPQ